MTGSVTYGGCIFILQSRVALGGMVDSCHVLYVLSKF